MYKITFIIDTYIALHDIFNRLTIRAFTTLIWYAFCFKIDTAGLLAFEEKSSKSKSSTLFLGCLHKNGSWPSLTATIWLHFFFKPLEIVHRKQPQNHKETIQLACLRAIYFTPFLLLFFTTMFI